MFKKINVVNGILPRNTLVRVLRPTDEGEILELATVQSTDQHGYITVKYDDDTTGEFPHYEVERVRI